MSLNYIIKDKVVVLTGSYGGIGSRLAEAFLDEGAKFVALLDLQLSIGEALEKQLTTTYGKGRTKFYKCDVTSDVEEVYEAIMKDAGYIDVVVNNAGIFNDKQYVRTITINLLALVTSSLKALKMMRKDNGGEGGTIINISSVAALSNTYFMPIYSATKSAVLQFSHCLGMEPNYSRTGVRVITICFGATDTPMMSNVTQGTFDEENNDQIMEYMKSFPMQTPESAANGVIHAFKYGTSASTWLVSADQSEDITERIKEAYTIMGEGITDK